MRGSEGSGWQRCAGSKRMIEGDVVAERMCDSILLCCCSIARVCVACRE